MNAKIMYLAESWAGLTATAKLETERRCKESLEGFKGLPLMAAGTRRGEIVWAGLEGKSVVATILLDEETHPMYCKAIRRGYIDSVEIEEPMGLDGDGI